MLRSLFVALALAAIADAHADTGCELKKILSVASAPEESGHARICCSIPAAPGA